MAENLVVYQKRFGDRVRTWYFKNPGPKDEALFAYLPTDGWAKTTDAPECPWAFTDHFLVEGPWTEPGGSPEITSANS